MSETRHLNPWVSVGSKIWGSCCVARMRTLLLLFGMAAAAAKKILVLHGSGGSAGAFLARLSPVRSATAASYKDWRPTAFSYSAIDAPSGDAPHGASREGLQPPCACIHRRCAA